LDYYRRESKKVHQIISDGVLDGVSERASIDEAFIDFTRPIINIILDRWPELRYPPADNYDAALPSPPANISWDGLGWLIPVCSSQSEDMDEAIPDPPITWHDVGLSIAASLMAQIRADIDTKLGYTTSAVCNAYFIHPSFSLNFKSCSRV
jgi:DNA polymerase eta